MKRISAVLIALFVASATLPAQHVRGVFSFADSLMRFSRIGTAGKQYVKPVPIKPSVWTPEAYDDSLQPRYAADQRGFVNYLLDRGLRDDALVLLAQPDMVPSDTLSYLRGLALFDDLQLEAADRYLSASSLEPALFFDVVTKAHLGLHGEARTILSSYQGNKSELKHLQLAGISLLEADVNGYNAAAAGFTYSDFNLTDSERALDDIARTIAAHPKRSPLAASALSAVLPGAGQLYAGSLGEALSAFLTVGSLAGITAANWHKYGLKSWRTIVSGSICSIFYIGNIYGAYISVDIHNQEFYNETAALVLYNIHIPLRNIYR